VVLPLVSETLRYARPHEHDPTITSGRTYQKPGRGASSVSGDLVLRLNPLAHCFLLKQLLGPPSTTGSGPYTHTFGVGTPPVGFEIERGFPEDGEYYLYKGLRASKLSLTFGGSGLLSVTVGVIGGAEVVGAAPVVASPTSHPHEAFELGGAVTMLEGGQAIASCTEVTLELDNETEADPAAIGGGGGPAGVGHGKAKVTGRLKAMFYDKALYEKAKNHTQSTLSLALSRGDGLGSLGNESATFAVGALVYEPNAPTVETPRGLFVELPFSAYGASCLTVTVKNSLAQI
jgi:hypothetical protein